MSTKRDVVTRRFDAEAILAVYARMIGTDRGTMAELMADLLVVCDFHRLMFEHSLHEAYQRYCESVGQPRGDHLPLDWFRESRCIARSEKQAESGS